MIRIKEVIKKWGKRIVHQIQLLFEILQNHDLGRRTKYAYYYRFLPVNKRIVMYESFFGRGMVCNPYAIFLELLHNPEYAKYQHVWVLDKLENHTELIREYIEYKNVKFVEYQNRHYLKYLCKAGYLINNVTFPAYYTKKQGQVYVNTWHGIPLKTLGYDMPNGKTEVGNVVRNMLISDFMIAANPFLKQIYLKSYKMEHLYQGKIIEEGYPRLDILNRFTREQIIGKLQRYGMEADPDRRIILYAPTWKGESYGMADAGVEVYYKFKEELEKYIDVSRYQILVKVHQRVFELAKDKLTEGWFVPATIDANEVLAVTDILISDFSSIFYDFLGTGKPVLFYIPDADSYKKQRGMYMAPDGLPGPYTDRICELAHWIQDIENIAEKYRDQVHEQAVWADAIHEENISRKIVDIVFAGHEEGYAIHREKKDRKNILISRGRMLVNGISTSLLNLLNNIDYSDWDVTLMITEAGNGNEAELIEKINPNVRVMLRESTVNMTYFEQTRHKYYMKYGIKNPYQKMYFRETKRAYGDAVFDYAVDFEGYSLFYALLILQITHAWRGIWMHNDMMNEKKQKFPWLESIFCIYHFFDAAISCSSDIMKVNAKNLSHFCDGEKFHYAKNMIDVSRIEEGVAQDCICEYNGEKYVRVDQTSSDGCIQVKMLPLLREKKADGRPSCTFVNVARLSEEKNQENLIRAVSRLALEGVNVYLYILGGGPLKSELSKLISNLQLKERVVLAGNVKNPFAVMRQCDCFVLPSCHEGQPMVVHEARALQMPVIVSDFESVSGVSTDNGQYLTGKGVDDIYEGLKAYIEGRVPADYQFDVNVYNKEAYQEFENALDIRKTVKIRSAEDERAKDHRRKGLLL
ncbi:MAG: CDP-glycerol glycerophosphotransferase family protein [Lachnospiraceae bacterium]|nr:CDP-glycerol glycerophosphotransferase family protein [Lachnospiraceae bacterium]